MDFGISPCEGLREGEFKFTEGAQHFLSARLMKRRRFLSTFQNE
jgi:hypothetical protein